VTVPLFALGWALLFLHPEPLLKTIAGTAQLTVILGVAPLIGGVALAGVMGVSPRDGCRSRRRLRRGVLFRMAETRAASGRAGTAGRP
jgi:hypothetical protein